MLTWAVVRRVLHMPKIVEEAKESLRDEVRKKKASDMAVMAMQACVPRVVKKRTEQSSIKMQTRASVSMLLANSSVILSPQYVEAMTKFTCWCLLRGAAKKMQTSEEMRKANFEDPSDRRRSLPTPIVFLSADNGWGNWLATHK